MQNQRDVVVIGGTGDGVRALIRVVSKLPANLAASVIVVMDTPSNDSGELLESLKSQIELRAEYATQDQQLEPGHLYLSPADRHLLVLPTGRLGLSKAGEIHSIKPAADPLFESAAATFGARVIGVLLGGADHNGAKGLKAIHEAGGLCVVQSPNDALVPASPMNALLGGHIDHCELIDNIPRVLLSLVTSPRKKPV